MFKMVAQATFTHEVTFSVPIDGGHEDQKTRVRYNVLPHSTVAKFDLSTHAGTVDFLRAATAEVLDISDATGQPLSWSPAVFDQLVDLPFTRLPLTQGYFNGINGAKTGN